MLPLLLGAAIVFTLAFAPRADAFVYWSNWGLLLDDTEIARANNNGTGQTRSFIPNGIANQPTGLSLSSNRIYWARENTTSLGTANLNGAPASVNLNFVATATAPAGTANNSTHLFWTQAGSNSIGRANIDGGAGNQSFITGASTPIGVAVNPTHIFWANSGTDKIGRADLAGTPASVDQSYIDTGVNSEPSGLAIDGTHIYWTNFTQGTIGRVELDGDNPQLSWIAGADNPCDLAIDGGKLYWAEQGNESIGRADLGGEFPANIDHEFIDGSNLNRPCGIAVNSLAVPACQNSSTSIGQDDSVGIDLKCTGGSLTHSIVTQPAHGKLSGLNPSAGAVTYTPDIGFSGSDSFKYRASNPGSVNPSNTATASITVASKPEPPCDAFTLGTPLKNKKKGTAELPVTIPCGGELELAGGKVKPASVTAEQAGDFTLPIKAKGKAKKKLKKKGKAKVTVDVTFSPEGGDPGIQSTKVKLKKKR